MFKKNFKKNKKLILILKGGLGNQLFSYSCAKRLALRSNAELVIDDTSGFLYDKLYNRSFQLHHFNIPHRIASNGEKLQPFSRLRRKLMKTLNKFIPYFYKFYIEQDFISYDKRLIDKKLMRNTFIEGYWQSENYFMDIEEIIRNDLKIKSKIDDENIKLGEQIKKSNSISIHLRFFDTLDMNDTINVNNDYYLRAMSYMEKRYSDCIFYVFSDDPNKAKEKLKVKKNIIFVNVNNKINKEYVDLWLMSLCKHHIIANSTFSWWGAWLSNNKKKIIVAPDLNIQGENIAWWGFEGLIPPNWIKL